MELVLMEKIQKTSSKQEKTLVFFFKEDISTPFTDLLQKFDLITKAHFSYETKVPLWI